MSVLVLGGTGMLGHRVWRECDAPLDAWATVRDETLTGPAARVLDRRRTVTGVHAEDAEAVGRALECSGANAVVNCIAVVDQRLAECEPSRAIAANALFPRRLAAICQARDVRLIHISTDSVFSGRRGGYREGDPPDPVDVYGRSKLLGEPSRGALTLRTAIIGRELSGERGLVEWLLARRGETVRGWTRAIFNGVTTGVLAALIRELIESPTSLEGVRHVGGDSISKHDLLLGLRDGLDIDLDVEPDSAVIVDRTLDSTALKEETGWRAPAWPEMIAGLARDSTPYEDLRGDVA